jgi:hypothetical protein
MALQEVVMANYTFTQKLYERRLFLANKQALFSSKILRDK